MLALAKVEQLRHQGNAAVIDRAASAREVVLDLAPLIADCRLDFSISAGESPVRAHEWALRELTRNLLHNAVKNAPEGSRLTMACDSTTATLTLSDCGPGISAEQRLRLFQPFSPGAAVSDKLTGSGLGLAICLEIVQSLGGRIALDNREQHGQVEGLDATVGLPLADNSTR